jgi:oligosaccharide repeat unit polymerase
MLASIFPAVYYHLYKNGFVGKRILKVVLAISIFILMNMLSRQIMILALLTFLFIYAKEKDLSIDKVMLKGIGYGAIIFFIIGSIRYAAINDGVSELEFMKAYSGVPKALNVNMFDVSFNLYTSMNFATLNEFVNNAGEMHYGINMFRPVIEIFKIDQAFNIYYDPKLNSFSLLATIVADPFLDFGLLGVIFLPFFYGIFISKVYLNYQVSKNLGHSLGWSICVYVMVMSVFTNFFNVLFIWICLLYSLLFIFKVTIKKARSTNDIK